MLLWPNFAVIAVDQVRSSSVLTEQQTIKLSESERQSADQWQLSHSEWRRYQLLMQGVRGSLSVATITPLEVLGIHARDDTERRYYAERWAQLMYEDTERVLSFQRAYDQAFRRLYGSQPFIDLTQLPSAAALIQLLPGDRLLFFTRTDCKTCQSVLQRALSVVTTSPERNTSVDIYLLDSQRGEEDKVRRWAQQQAIAPVLVQQQRVTLNHDNGLLASLTDKPPIELPMLLLKRAGQVQIIAAAALGR